MRKAGLGLLLAGIVLGPAVAGQADEKEPKDVYGWMSWRLVNYGLLGKLDLTDNQKGELKKTFAQEKKVVMANYMKEMRGLGECPTMALKSRKYKPGSPEEFCAGAELTSLGAVPLQKKIKKILTKDQYQKYQQGVKVLVKYGKQARKLMKSGKKGKTLANLHQKTLKKIGKIFAAKEEKEKKA